MSRVHKHAVKGLSHGAVGIGQKDNTDITFISIQSRRASLQAGVRGAGGPESRDQVVHAFWLGGFSERWI